MRRLRRDISICLRLGGLIDIDMCVFSPFYYYYYFSIFILYTNVTLHFSLYRFPKSSRKQEKSRKSRLPRSNAGKRMFGNTAKREQCGGYQRGRRWYWIQRSSGSSIRYYRYMHRSVGWDVCVCVCVAWLDYSVISFFFPFFVLFFFFHIFPFLPPSQLPLLLSLSLLKLPVLLLFNLFYGVWDTSIYTYT